MDLKSNYLTLEVLILKVSLAKCFLSVFGLFSERISTIYIRVYRESSASASNRECELVNFDIIRWTKNVTSLSVH